MNVVLARRTLIWGVLSALLGVALLASFPLTGSAVRSAEADAQRRAEDYASTVLYKALTPGLVDDPIEGRDYGEVLVQVQAGILSNDDVVRVRIWNRSGKLVFSSDQRDRLGQEAGFDGVLKRVLDGGTVSDATGPRVAPQPGLAGSNEQLLRSYVPLRLGEQSSASGAAEIDQRYSAILASAYRIWRPVQIALGVGFLAALVMLLVSFRSGAIGSGAAGDPRAAERIRSLERQLKELDKRAKDADERAKGAEQRADAVASAKSALEQQLATSERNLRETLATARTNDEGAAALTARVPELEREIAELRARAAAAESTVPGISREELAAAESRAHQAETERDRLAREIERLNIAMSESGAAHARTGELESRIAELEAARSDAERRVSDAEARAADAEARAADADRRSSTAVEQTQGDLERTSLRLSETQTALAESTDRVTSLQAELERVTQEKADALAELERAGLATGERDQEVERLRSAMTEREEELERLRSAMTERDERLQELRQSVVERDTELEELRSGLGERSGEIERARAEASTLATELERLRAADATKSAELEEARAALASKDDELGRLRSVVAERDAEITRTRADLEQATTQAAASQPAPDVDELRRRLTELEELRRTDLAEVQRAHEQLANTQLELKQARRRVDELEERARKLAAASLQGTPLAVEPDSNGASAAEPPPNEVADDASRFEAPEEATIASRLSAFRRRRHAPHADESEPQADRTESPDAEVPAEPEPAAGDQVPEISAEGLSLRERLTRAAAARHRVTTPSDHDEG